LTNKIFYTYIYAFIATTSDGAILGITLLQTLTYNRQLSSTKNYNETNTKIIKEDIPKLAENNKIEKKTGFNENIHTNETIQLVLLVNPIL
jgi:hypothetical protein